MERDGDARRLELLARRNASAGIAGRTGRFSARRSADPFARVASGAQMLVHPAADARTRTARRGFAAVPLTKRLRCFRRGYRLRLFNHLLNLFNGLSKLLSMLDKGQRVR